MKRGLAVAMDDGELLATIQTTLDRGPTRVIVDREGLGVSPGRAMNAHGIIPDLIFVRNDGWSLGAPTDLIDVALSLWRAEYVAVINVQTKDWRRFDESGEWRSVL